jgi:hypothetical protein
MFALPNIPTRRTIDERGIADWRSRACHHREDGLRLPARQPGVVRSGPTTDKGGKTYYGVSMDKDDQNDGTLFLADEIEADA